MERSKSIASIIVGIAAVIIIWKVGFVPIPEKPTVDSGQTQVAAQTNTQRESRRREPRMTSDTNEPGRFGDANEPQRFLAADDTQSEDPNDPLVNLSLNNAEMRLIVQRLTEWTNKVIIPTDEAMRVKITIYAPQRVPRSQAMMLIYSALRMKGYTARQAEDAIYIEPLGSAKLGEVPVIPADYPLAKIENKEQVVNKFFSLKNYSPSQMGQILLPMIGEYGYLSADEDTGTLQVIDTVKNLMKLSLIIEQFDVVEAEATKTEIFEIHHGDPSEIVTLLQQLLTEGGVTDIRSAMRNMRNIRTQAGGPQANQGSGNQNRSGGSNNQSRRGGSSGGGTATSVSVGTSRTQPVLIAVAKLNWVVAKATEKDLDLIGEWINKLDQSVPTVLAEVPLASVENKNQIVQKFFQLKNYSPSSMAQVIGPMLNDSGYVSADENTRMLLVNDTVENLIRIEGVIRAFDVPEAEQAVPQIFQIKYGDPSEIVQLLKMLLSEEGNTSSSNSSRNVGFASSSNRNSRNTRTSNRGYSSGSYRTSSSSNSASIVGTDNLPVVLIPEPKRKWIIARGSAETIKRIGEWIDKLDRQETYGKDYETVAVKYADVSEVAERIGDWLEQMPGTDIVASVLVQPLEQSKQVMIFGKEDLREMVKKLIQEVDIPSGQFITEHFKLKNADPEEIKEKLDELYSSTSSNSSSNRSYYYIYSSMSSRGSSTSSDTVKVIAYVALRQVTVVASPENMDKIRKQIEEWDVPIDTESLKPRIIELNNVDPEQMADLLTSLFSGTGSSSSSSSGMRQALSYMLGSTSTDQEKIIGPLYGQLTFEDVPGTKKIIVISNIAQAYDVVEDLVRELDKEEMAEVPTVVTLKFADPDNLCQILNAMFSEAGASVQIQLSATGLSTYTMDTSSSSSDSSSSSTSTNQSSYTPYWASSSARNTTDTERPISNVIGKIRFVPDSRTKSVLVLSPPEFIPKIQELIAELDIPGKQVMIKAVIVEIDHQNLTSLGVQLASNSTAFGTLGENSVTALNALEQLDTHGAAIFGASGKQGTVVTNTLTSNINVLIDFLIKHVNAKVLNQQTLWTEDNEEASFFKGQNVAFYTAATTGTGTSTQNFEFQRVGMNLAVRPSITPTKDVDMIVNIIISQLSGDQENGQPVRTEMETKTNMIVGDGETLMLGGILFQKDSLINRKIPLLGDIPIIGGLFNHNSTVASNNEMLVFITPYVIDEPDKTSDVTKEQIEKSKQKLESILQGLDQTMEKLDK